MNDQEIFNTVATHLLRQGIKSTSIVGKCSYRGQLDTKCAIGCLIDDKYYSTNLEGFRVNGGTVSRAVAKSLGFYPDMYLLSELQMIHDLFKVEEWRRELQQLAKKLNLSFPEEI